MSTLGIGMHWFHQGGGGTDRYFHGLATALRADDADFHGLVFGQPDPSAPGITFLGDATLPMAQRLRRIRRGVHAAAPPALLATHFALYALPVLDLAIRTPHVVHFHGPWADESAAEGASPAVVAAKRTVERLVYATADRLIVLSEAFKSLLVDRYRVSAHKIRVVPGGLHTANYQTPLSRADARLALGWPPDRPILLCVRRLTRRMGLESLIDAVASLRPAHPDILLLIAGRGRLHDELHRRIAERNLSAHIRLLGFVPEDRLAASYRAADLSVVPSQSLEGFGLVAVESLASGTPVMVTPVGGLPEVIAPFSADLVFPGADAGAIAAGLAAALAGKIPLPDAARCAQYARDQFDWSRILPRVLSIYAEARQR